jgi:hypothetical protein
VEGWSFLALSAFEKGKLKIAAHVREELELARVAFDEIHCRSGGLHVPPNVTRLIIVIDGEERHLDLLTQEVEDCEILVTGETWHKIDGFIRRLHIAG